MRIFIPLLALFLSLHTPIAAAAGAIEEYASVFLPFRDSDGRLLIALRSFMREGKKEFLLVDPSSFRTRVSGKESLRFVEEEVATTPFFRAVEEYNAPPYRLQNQGLIRGDRSREGVFLTVDLCPSAKPLEREMFEELVRQGEETGKPVAVAVAVSGVWMERHGEELEILRKLAEKGAVEITWVNHSWSHPYRPGTPLEKNFLLEDEARFEEEVLRTEKLLLEKGLVPSVFFRYPGLVSGRALSERLRRLSLIPLGSDAWLAKGEKPEKGSVILVHGNGNEPKGIRLLLDFLRGEGKRVPLLPLASAISDGPEVPFVAAAPDSSAPR